MRTTVTLDPDVAALVRKSMAERGLTFKQAINSALRAALAESGGDPPFSTPTSSMGFDPSVGWDKALRLAGELEDVELVRKLRVRK